MKTLILILLDESGSMCSQKEKVITGFDQFITEQKMIANDEAIVTFIKFNTAISIVYDCVPVADVSKLQNYQPRGGTSLYDAIFDGVKLVEPREHQVDRVVCLIITDGQDSGSSHKANASGIGHLIRKKEHSGKWTFLYIGQDPERWAQQTGMSANNATQFDFVEQGNNFLTSAAGVSKIRNQNALQVMNALHDLFDKATGNGSPSHISASPIVATTSKPTRPRQQRGVPNALFTVRRSPRLSRSKGFACHAVRSRANGTLRSLVNG